MAKRIAIVVPGQGEEREIRDVAVLPGTRVFEAVKEMGVDNPTHFVLEDEAGNVYVPGDNLFELARDGGKFYLRPDEARVGSDEKGGAGVYGARSATYVRPTAWAADEAGQTKGSGFFGQLRSSLGKGGAAAPAARPSRARRIVPDSVERARPPLWQVRGWHKHGSGYFGFFRERGATWPGEVVHQSDGTFWAFIRNAPSRVLSGPHGRCFALTDPNRHRVHLSPPARTPEEAIGAVERLLAGS